MRRITVALAVAFTCAACGGDAAPQSTSATAPPAPTATVPAVTAGTPTPTLVTVDLASGAIVTEQPTDRAELVAVQTDQAILQATTEENDLLAGPTSVVQLEPASGVGVPVVLVDGTGQVIRFDASGQRTLAPTGSAIWPGAAPVAQGIAAVLAFEKDRPVVVGVDAGSGETVWRSTAGMGPPAAGGEIVAAVATDVQATRSKVVGLDARTGTERRRTTLPFGFAFDLSMAGDQVFVSGSTPDGVKRRAALLDAATGRILWSVDLTRTPVDAEPALVGDALWTAGSGGDATDVAAARSVADGRILHELPVTYTTGEAPAASADAVALPLDDGLVLLDAATGEQRWRLPGSYGGPIIAGNRLYAVRDGL